MNLSSKEIAELAEFIAGQNISKGKVNLEKIARKNKIKIIYNNYGPHFVGKLVHSSKKFYMHINLDKIPVKYTGRIRFTIAHEFGHFFIDTHRTKLEKGISLSFISENPAIAKLKHELEADHFASHLLMPENIFVREARKFEPGIETVLALKKYFDTSIECTAIHYVKLNILPCLLIRWKSDPIKHYSFYSDSLANLTGISHKPVIKVHAEYLNSLFAEIDNSFPKIEYVENVAPLSKWIATITPGSKSDLVGLEQTFKLGEYGGLTFLLF